MTSDPARLPPLRSTPPGCLLTALVLAARNRLHRQARLLGRTIQLDDGRTFTIFRHWWLDPRATRSDRCGDDAALLIVRFRFRHGSIAVNRRLSLAPAPAIAGFPGFRAKLWAVDETREEFTGLYSWASVHAAQQYRRSFILAAMNHRAAPGSVSTTILPTTDLNHWLTAHLQPPTPDS